ncbi:MAG: hypothetical protein B5M56_05875 [Desulfococcus sp. 4484_241]|nr:MAG: hypothetical protein B5M56_05875 [Desulfococcus sp. 4484_241]
MNDKNTVPHRMDADFPFAVWLLGWIAILKGIVWLTTDPNIPDVQLAVMGCKYLFFMLPLIACAIGAWHLKRWAAWGIAALCIADLLFFLLYPPAIKSLAINDTSPVVHLFSTVVWAINGPLGDIAMIALATVLFRHTKKAQQ